MKTNKLNRLLMLTLALLTMCVTQVWGAVSYSPVTTITDGVYLLVGYNQTTSQEVNAAGALNTGGKFWGKESVTNSGTKITNAGSAVEFTITKEETVEDVDYYSIHDGTGYICFTGTGNADAKRAETLTDACKFKIEYIQNAFRITNKSYTSRGLRYNSSSPRFTNYGSTSQTAISLYLKEGATQYTVTYDSNGKTSGSVPTDATKYDPNASVTVKGNTGNLARNGYSWGGWNTKADGSGITYAAGSTFKITANTTLYAKWNDKTYTDYITECGAQTCDWQINYQEGGSSGSWSEGNCFKQVGETSEWQITNFTMPNTSGHFWVGPGEFKAPSNWGHSVDAEMTTIKIAKRTNGENIDWSPMIDAVGTLRIYSNASTDNYQVGFLPTYQITFGGTGAWENIQFAYVSGTTYETDVVITPADLTGINYYVGVRNSEGNTNFVMWSDSQKKSNTLALSSMTGMAAGIKGKYRIYEDSGDQNWYCQFIPLTTGITAQGNGGTFDGVETYCTTSFTWGVVPTICGTPSNDGSVFQGFTKTENGTDFLFDENGDVVANVTDYTDGNGKWIYEGEDLTIYAKWGAPADHYFVAGVDTYQEVPVDGHVTLPTATPTSCDPTEYPYFVGWSSVDFNSRNEAPTTMITAETTSTGGNSYYAVFAKGEAGGALFTETFNTNDGTGGNDGSWSGSIASAEIKSDNNDWTFVKGNGAKTCAKFGTGSALGSAQTPAITMTNGTLTFKAAAWNANSESTTLKLSLTSGTLKDGEGTASVTLTKGAWTDYTLYISGVTTSTKIKFEGNATSNSRFFLDEVVVSGGTNYTEWITRCCEQPGTALSISGEATVAYNTDLALTANGGNGGTVSWSVEPSANTTITATGTSTTFRATKKGTYTITASQEKNGSVCATEAQKEVTVTAALTSISVIGQTTTFYVGDTYTFDGLCTATYVDGSTADVTPTNTAISVASPFTAAGSATATITYTEDGVTRTAEYPVTIKATRPWTITLVPGSGVVVGGAATVFEAMGAITLPACNVTCDSWTFAGWAEAQVATQTSTAPTLVATAANLNYTATKNVNLYAVYKKTVTTPGGTFTSTTTFGTTSGSAGVTNNSATDGATWSYYKCQGGTSGAAGIKNGGSVTYTAPDGAQKITRIYFSKLGSTSYEWANGATVTITQGSTLIATFTKNTGGCGSSATTNITDVTTPIVFASTTSSTNNYIYRLNIDWVSSGGTQTTYYNSIPCDKTITWENEMMGTNTTTSVSGTTLTLPAGTPESCDDNYTFYGWGDQIPNSKTTAPAIKQTGDTYGTQFTYFAIFKHNTRDLWYTKCPISNDYTFVLDKNTGSADGSVTFALNAPAPDAFSFTGTRTGYTLSGFWTTVGSPVGKGGGTMVLNTDGTIANNHRDWVADGKWIQTDENQRLYAGWTANTYQVRYNANGGTGSMDNTSFTYDAAAKALRKNTFTRTGYTFQGWATTAEGAKIYDDQQTVQNLTAENNAIIDLYAVWTANTHSLTLVKGDGDCSVVTDAIPYGTEVTITANPECTPEFYRFKDWTVNAGGITLADASANPTTFTMGDKDVTITANYEEDNYTFVLDKNGGDADGSVTFTYGKSEYKTFTAATKTGYYTAGYYQYATSGSKVLETNGALNSSDVTNWIADGKWAQKDEIKKLYPHWTANTYYIEYNDNGKTGGSAMTKSTLRYDQAANLKPNTYTKTGYTFAGWSKIQDGAVVYTDGQEVNNLTAVNGETITLYAKWTPISYTVVYDGNGKTGGSMSNQSFNYDQSKALLTNNFTKQGSAFLGWSTVKDGPKVYDDKEVVSNLTATAGATVTLYAKWELQFGTITLSGDVHLTSGNGISVYTTPSPDNLITLSCDNLGVANSFKIEYLDESDKVVSATNSLFRLCYAPGYEQGNSAYAVADATNIPLSSAEKEAGSYERKFAISYTPNKAGVTNVEKLRLTAMTSGNAELASAIITLNGRSLPERFVIAMKNPNNGYWYALKNELGSTAAGATPAPEMITVDDNTNPTKATLAPASTFYKTAARFEPTKHRGAVRFQQFDGSKYLTATKTNNTSFYMPAGNDDDQQFYLNSTDLSKYKVTLDPATGSTRYISMNGGTIGWFATEAKDVYFLPIENVQTPVEFQVVEWKTSSVVVMYTGSAATATTQVGLNAASSAQTLSTAKKDHCVYELSTVDLTSEYGKVLTVQFDGSSKMICVPLIVSGETTASSGTAGNDVVVLKGGTFKAESTERRYPNITVYGGGKLVVGSEKKLAFSQLIMRAGGFDNSGNYDYVYPQVVLNGTLASGVDKLYYEYITDYSNWYHLALPFNATLTDICYPVDIYGNNVAADNHGSWVVKRYDGATRAGGNYAAWKDIETEGKTAITAGQGYIFWGAPKKVSQNGADAVRQAWGIQRMKLDVNAADAPTEEMKNKTVAVAPYPAEKVNDKGWNLIGNPYMAPLTGLSSNSIMVGHLIEKKVDGQWTGGWELDPNDDAEKLRYITVPDAHFNNYEAVRVTGYELTNGKVFFVQIEDGNGIEFNANQRKNAPAYIVSEESVDMETGIVLSGASQHDEVNFWIKDGKTADYEFNADYPKTMNATNFNLYGVHTAGDLSWIAISPEVAKSAMPLGFQVPTAGSYTLSLSEGYDESQLSALYLTDHEMVPEVTVDLLIAPYNFDVNQAEINNTRFTVSMRLANEGPTTSIEQSEMIEDIAPRKFIYQDKMYIQIGNVIYDATGKLVNNK